MANWALGTKTRMVWLPGKERNLTISSLTGYNTPYTNVTDRQTDGHRPTAKTAPPLTQYA